jgi:hypothetical protein
MLKEQKISNSFNNEDSFKDPTEISMKKLNNDVQPV